MAADELSVLMAVWAGDRGEWLDEALRSIAAQTLRADEVVVVEDGPITAEVAAVLEASELPITRVALPANIGLSGALQEGLAHCHHELIARVDSDDVNEPDRFARQVATMRARPNLSALSGYVSEFVEDPESPYAVRTVPVGAAQVARAARWRSPLNHPAVMMRLSHIQAVGGYTGFVSLEDYYLWGKLLAAGHEIDNLPEVLVRMRAGAAQGRRRGGLRYARTEIELLRAFVRIGFLTRSQALVSMVVRVPVRLVPDPIRAIVYRYILRRKVGHE
jgi:glycosyltransferase involved in cell wall biosynthesis